MRNQFQQEQQARNEAFQLRLAREDEDRQIRLQRLEEDRQEEDRLSREAHLARVKELSDRLAEETNFNNLFLTAMQGTFANARREIADFIDDWMIQIDRVGRSIDEEKNFRGFGSTGSVGSAGGKGFSNFDAGGSNNSQFGNTVGNFANQVGNLLGGGINGAITGLTPQGKPIYSTPGSVFGLPPVTGTAAGLAAPFPQNQSMAGSMANNIDMTGWQFNTANPNGFTSQEIDEIAEKVENAVLRGLHSKVRQERELGNRL